MPNAAHGAHVTGSPGQAGGQAGEEITPAGPKGPPEAPSWSRVLVTTLSLWASRRLPGPRRPRTLLLIVCVLAAGAAAVGVVQLTSTSSRAARVSSPTRPHQVRPSRSVAAAVGYQAALAADVAARRSAGAQLLRSRRIEVGAPATGQIQAGQVDSRLLIMLALLASQRSWRVIAFGDASPPVPLTQAPFRQVIITGAGGADGASGAGGLAAALALLAAQRAPYQPAQVATVHLADGRAGLRIDFAAPSPLGLLTNGAHK